MKASLIPVWRWYRARATVVWLAARHRVLRHPVTGDAPVAVSLTSHSTRVARVHTCIQSIAAGKVRPRRLILWLNGDPDPQALPPELRELQARGLEIRHVPNYGPHTKYFPYVLAHADDGLPLVTADDDAIYARDWLRGLVAAHQAHPGCVQGYWALKLQLGADGRVAPYHTWPTVNTDRPCPTHFALGVAGIIYPAALLKALRDAGDAFRQCCPRADDVWLHAMALRHGYPVRQVRAQWSHPRVVPYTQDIALFHENCRPEGNDAQVQATYTAQDLARLADMARLA